MPARRTTMAGGSNISQCDICGINSKHNRKLKSKYQNHYFCAFNFLRVKYYKIEIEKFSLKISKNNNK